MNSKFLLLLGVSGVGKSTIIKRLRELDDRFVYISPFVTRKLREGERDKVSVTSDEMDRLIVEGAILVVNEIYSVRYATPSRPIEEAFSNSLFPLLDWPIAKLPIMAEKFPGRLFSVYIEPPNITELKRRLGKDDRDKNGKRLLEAIKELEILGKGRFDDQCDLRLTLDNNVEVVADIIYRAFLHSMK